MITLTDKKVGVWGLGSVGKAALAFLSQQKAQCSIYDQRTFTNDERELLHRYQLQVYGQEELDQFLQSHDYILASPGVDITPYRNKAHFLCELDLFAPIWHKPSIGITGTIGKTTVTTLLHMILQKEMMVAMGGNIGIPLLDIITQQEHVDVAVVELSSWQLEYAHTYAPDIAIWTNLYPNHLNRHHTMDNYFQAKAHLLTYQTNAQTAIIPLALWDQIQDLKIKSHCIWIHHTKPKRRYFDRAQSMIYLDNDQVIYWQNGLKQKLICVDQLPTCTFTANWLFVLATLMTLKLPTNLINDCSIQLEHRLEKVGTYNNLTFYNDSKATTPEATLAAVGQFKHDKIILFLGGLSKGVDRSTLVSQLPKNVIAIICFGKEAHLLKAMCDKQQLKAYACTNLEEAFHYARKINNANITLFSPSGASFDLYANYQDRGDHFKQLVAFLG